MDITSLEQQAIDYARRGDFGADAKRVNEELTKIAPSNEGGWTRLARCNIELGLLDDASVALETVLQLNPQNTIARSLLQEAIRRSVRLETPEPAPKRKRAPAAPRAAAKPRKSSKAAAPVRGGFGRAQLAALGQLAPEQAVESLNPAIEPLLVALNDRPFAEKVVEARNRAAHAGNVLFRRNSLKSEQPGHVFAFHHGGRWEPQIRVGFYSAPQWERSAVCAGIGFDFSIEGDDADDVAGAERISEYFESLQRLAAGEWNQLLTRWMAAHGGFIQYADRAPETAMMPDEAVRWLVQTDPGSTGGWVFVGRWLFADRAGDVETIHEPTQLTKWMEATFVDLLPLWMSIYRGE